MALGNVSVVGVSGSARVRVAASATRGYAGEPVNVAPSYTSGVSSVNTVVVAGDNTPVIGTDQFVGVLTQSMAVNSAGTVVAQRINCAIPIPIVTKVRAAAKTATTVDTDTEGIGLLWDIYTWDLTTSVYTFDAAVADTGGFQVRDYNYVRSTLDCFVDPRAMSRTDIT